MEAEEPPPWKQAMRGRGAILGGGEVRVMDGWMDGWMVHIHNLRQGSGHGSIGIGVLGMDRDGRQRRNETAELISEFT